jgi:cytochrome P450
MLRDPDIFLESDRFCPERWLSRSVPAFPTQGFGLAAWLCLGQSYARRSIWAIMAGILAALEIPSEFRLGVLSVNTETTLFSLDSR